MTAEKNIPKLKPKIKLQTINPKATKPPIFKILPKKEKSLRVVNATVVRQTQR